MPNINILKLELTPEQISGNSEGEGIALDISNGYEYKDGQKTDIVTYKKVRTVFPNNGYEVLNVKVLDLKLSMIEEQIQQQREVKVKFKNLRGKIYRTSNGDYAVSATADGLEVIR